jgi:hypothetical protein
VRLAGFGFSEVAYERGRGKEVSGEARAQGRGYSERAAGSDEAAVLKGLTFGNRAGIDPATVYDFRGAGAAAKKILYKVHPNCKNNVGDRRNRK